MHATIINATKEPVSQHYFICGNLVSEFFFLSIYMDLYSRPKDTYFLALQNIVAHFVVIVFGFGCFSSFVNSPLISSLLVKLLYKIKKMLATNIRWMMKIGMFVHKFVYENCKHFINTMKIKWVHEFHRCLFSMFLFLQRWNNECLCKIINMEFFSRIPHNKVIKFSEQKKCS